MLTKNLRRFAFLVSIIYIPVFLSLVIFCFLYMLFFPLSGNGLVGFDGYYLGMHCIWRWLVCFETGISGRKSRSKALFGRKGPERKARAGRRHDVLYGFSRLS